MGLSDFRTLGRSGLIVSPMALGTMTFGAQRWGSEDSDSRAVFDAYVDAGGNFIDTADVYAGGRSETMLGGFIAEAGLRDRIILATKAGFAREQGHPHAGGNGSKALRAALDGSLRRLRTDYVDLFWIHVWDTVTPAEEVLQVLGDLTRAGKVRHFGLSNTPAWYVAKMATLATTHGVPGPIALQLQYSLVERSIEQEFLPAAREFGLGVLPWSPLAGGFLSGKYQRRDGNRDGGGGAASEQPASSQAQATETDRLSGTNPFGDSLFTDRNWQVLDALRTVASEVDRPPAQVALAWALRRPGVTSLLLGSSRPAQLSANLSAMELQLTPEQTGRLDKASQPTLAYPYAIFAPAVNRMVFGGSSVSGWRA